MATGVSGAPRLPQLPGLQDFTGLVYHSSQFTDGTAFSGKRVVVVGTGTSGHDVAQDLWSHGAEVTLVQRSSSTVVSVGPEAAGRVYSIYLEGDPTEVTDLVSIATPYAVLRQSYQQLSRYWSEYDRGLLEGLDRIGFRTDYGDDNTGFQMKYMRHGGGYYLDVGCAQLLIDGSIDLLPYARIDRVASDGLLLTGGGLVAADAIVFATGYHGLQDLVRQLFDDEIADRVGPIWGFDDEGELRNMWRRTGQPGLWFTAGSLAQCRIFSKYLALQIKACELGLIPVRRPENAYQGRLRPADLEDA
jgi:cation diffusion facilitator CzcD-associated flavoprotein CzcO